MTIKGGMKADNKYENWLILAHCFNMDGRAASQTITDRIPFFLRKGIKPIVISAPTGEKDKNFPHFQVLSPAPSGIIFELRKVVEKHHKKGLKAEFFKLLITLVCFPFFVLEKLIVNLDSHWSWFLSAGFKGYFLADKYKIHLIYSSAGPSSSHLAGYILKKLTNRPWIAELHDPLVSQSGTIRKRYQRDRFNRWLEKKIFKHASAVIYFTQSACKNAQTRTGVNNNSFILRPGANPPDGAKDYKKKDKIHFGHFGSLASNRSLSVLMEAFHGLIQEDESLKDLVVLDVYGTDLDLASRKTKKRLGLDNVVCEHGRLEFDHLTGKTGRQQVFEQMNLCDVLVLLHGDSDIGDEYIPSKFYEYLLTGRPIAGFVSKHSELAEMLDSLGHFVIDPDSVGEIKAVLKTFIEKWKTDQLLEYNTKNSPFTVENTVERFLEIIEACLIKPVSS